MMTIKSVAKKIVYRKSNFAKAPSQKSATILFYVDDRSISFHSNNLHTDNGDIDNTEGAIGDSNQLRETTPNTVNLQENNSSLSSDSVEVLPVRLAHDRNDCHPTRCAHRLLPEEGQELWMVRDNKNLDAMDLPMVQRRKNTKPNAHTPTRAQKTDVGQSLYYREAMEGDKFEGNKEEEEEGCDNGKQRRRKTKRQANTQNTDSDNRNLDAMDVPMVQRRKNTKPNAHTPTRAQKTLSSKNNIDYQKVQQASLHLDTNAQHSYLQDDGGTTAAELPPPRDNDSGEVDSSSSDNEESLFLSSVIDLISVQPEEIGDVAMEVEHESVQQNP